MPLFYGLNLTGWDGDMRKHEVEFGNANLSQRGTEKPLYDPKIMLTSCSRFEFKLTPGANNGLGIRVPFMKACGIGRNGNTGFGQHCG